MNAEILPTSVPSNDELFELFKNGGDLRLDLEDGNSVVVHMWRISRETDSGSDWMIWGRRVEDMEFLYVYLKTDPVNPRGHVTVVPMEQYFGG